MPARALARRMSTTTPSAMNSPSPRDAAGGRRRRRRSGRLALALDAASSARRHQPVRRPPAGADVKRDPRTLALSLGRRAVAAAARRLAGRTGGTAILEVNVSQQPPGAAGFSALFGEPEVRIAARQAVPMLGAVLSYGRIVTTLQQAGSPPRPRSRAAAHALRHAGGAVKPVAGGVEIDAGIAEAVRPGRDRRGRRLRRSGAQGRSARLRPGGLGRHGRARARGAARRGLRALHAPRPGGAAAAAGRACFAMVWCVESDDDPVAALADAQRLAVLNTIFPAAPTPLRSITPLKRFELGLNAERTLTKAARCASAMRRRRCTRWPARASTSAARCRGAGQPAASRTRPRCRAAPAPVEWQRA